MSLIDTHAHIHSIDSPKTEEHTRELWARADLNANQVIQDAFKAGVENIICVGCSVSDSKEAVDFAKNRDGIFASIGIHPHEASVPGENVNNLKQVLTKDVIAVGECGLDFYYNHSKKEDQFKLFEDQIVLALENNLPLIFHCREAYDDFWPIFDSLNSSNKPIKGVLHSYTDNKENLDKALSRNLYIGVNGIATFAKEEQLEMYKYIPIDNLLFETDSPYLTPVPLRGRINEPKNVTIITEFMAELREGEVQDYATRTTSNAKRLFNI